MNQHSTKEDREHSFIERLNKQYPTIKYIGGYEDSDKEVTLQCKICGFIFNRTAQCIRGGRKLTCFNCQHKRNELVRLQKKHMLNIRKKKQKEKQKEIRDIYKRFKRNTIYIFHCSMCNCSEITFNKRRKICDKCARKHKYRCHSNKSLKEVYKRDKGICYICGGKCDYEDYIYHDNYFIAGNYYPSIDHVIPLNKGGDDSWNNIKLAHRICNSLKRDKIEY